MSASASSASDTQLGGARGDFPGEPLALGATGIHLWLCRHDHIPGSDEFKRRVLSRYASAAPADWQFALNERGKPSIAGNTHALDFNLSHSGDWLALAVTAGTPVGVDLEYCKRGRDVMRLARRFFCADEVAALRNCRGARRCERFYDLWTLKEAAVKARGEALPPSLNTRGFALDFPRRSPHANGCITVTTPELATDAQYCLLDPLPDYRLAICWLPGKGVAPGVRPLQLRVFELLDGKASDRPLTLRASTGCDYHARG